MYLLWDNYLFRRKNHRLSYSFWKCVLNSCNAIGNLYSISNRFVVTRHHNHPFDHEDVARRRLRGQLAALAKNSEESAESIVCSLNIPPEKVAECLKYVSRLRQRNKMASKVQQRASSLQKQATSCENQGQLRKTAGDQSQRLQPIQKKQIIEAGHDYDVIPSRHGNRATITRDGFLYRQYRGMACQSQLGAIYWRCVVDKCKVRAKTSNTGALSIFNTPHTHPVEATALSDPSLKDKLKEAAADLTRPLVEIFAELDTRDILARRYLHYVRKQHVKKAEEEEEAAAENQIPATNIPQLAEASPPPAVPPEMLDLSTSDLADPSSSFAQTPLEGFEPASCVDSLPVTLPDVAFTIEQLLAGPIGDEIL